MLRRGVFVQGTNVMKFARRFARFSPWAVAAVMALDLGNPIQAQTFKSAPVTKTAPRTMILNGDAVINVQIAWLSDPALLHCNLTAQETPEGIELVGYVPNEPVRQKALHIAKSICGEQVVNKLRIQAGMPVPLTRPAVPSELAPMASTILAEALGEKVMGLRITSPSAGKVEIAGSVPTSEDKLLVSKTMKKLNGCVYVVNKVQASGSSESAAIVKDVPMMVTMPATVIEEEPHRPVPVAVVPSAVKNPLKPMSADSAPTMVRSEPKSVAPPKIAPVVVVTSDSKPEPALPKSEPSVPIIVAKNEPSPDIETIPMPGKASVKNSVPADIQPIMPIVEASAPSAGKASISDLPADLVPKAASPIIVPPPVKPTVVESTPTVKDETPKPVVVMPPPMKPVVVESTPIVKNEVPKPVVVVPPPVVVKNEIPVTQPDAPKPKPPSAFNPLKIKTEAKPIEVVKNVEPEAPKLPEVKSEPTKPGTAAELPKVIELQPAPPTVVVESPKTMELNTETPKAVAVESPKKLELIPEAPKPVVEQPKTTVLIPETPKAVVELPKSPVVNPEPAPIKVEPGKASVAMPELPKATVSVAPAPKMEPTENPKAGVSSVSDMPATLPVVKETSKPVVPVVVAPEVKSEKMEPTENPKAGVSSVSDMRAPLPVVKETPKPVVPVVVAPEVKVEKTDRFAPPVPPVAPTKTMTYDAPAPAPLPTIKAEPALVSTNICDNKISGVIRQPGAAGSALDSNTVRKAIEDICRGSAENISVRETAGRQLTVGMKVSNQAEWDRLYNKVKNLPEVAGYAVIYNVSVEPTASKSPASSEPMRGIIRTSATSAPVEGDAVKKAIEGLCVGKADDIAIKTTGKQQVTVAMKVRSTGEWDKLYKQIKMLPEVAGYAVIYNVSIK